MYRAWPSKCNLVDPDVQGKYFCPQKDGPGPQACVTSPPERQLSRAVDIDISLGPTNTHLLKLLTAAGFSGVAYHKCSRIQIFSRAQNIVAHKQIRSVVRVPAMPR